MPFIELSSTENLGSLDIIMQVAGGVENKCPLPRLGGVDKCCLPGVGGVDSREEFIPVP